MMPRSTASTLAVIYSDDDGPELAGIIEGIEDAADVKVFRVTLNNELALAEATGSRIGRALHLAFSGTGGIAVVYPESAEPHRNAFTRIIEGIENKTKTKVASYPVSPTQNPQDLAAELKRQNIQVVIALGRNGLKATTGLEREIGVVVGGVVTAGEARGMLVHSLVPDPALLFSQLKVLMPNMRRIFVVYDPRQNAWLIRLAREAAKNLGMELVAQEATDLKTAMRYYQDVFAAADPKKDALWLPQDSVTVDDSSVLPLILQEVWSRSLTMFSSNVAHVKRGALFSLYPNNIELGHTLANSALSKLSSGSQLNSILPLKDVLVAVNTRTAVHLGLNLSSQQQQAYGMVYPEQ